MHSTSSPISTTVSKVLDFAVVPGFSKIGFLIRKKLGGWSEISDFDLTGKTVVITGPTSGLGAEVARLLAPTGAKLILVGRNPQKLAAMIAEIEPKCLAGKPEAVIAEMGNLSAVRRACVDIQKLTSHIDVLVHNAGALLNSREVSVDGIEQTIASHVVGPYLMTSLLLPELQAGRVVTVSSGGMYTKGIPDLRNGASLEMSADMYNGSQQYAIAKRAQVTLNEIWAERVPETEFVAMHPGWADTPGVQESIPGFRRVTAPILRSAREGADTIAWLAAVDALPGASGTFWCDRETWPIHKSSGTKKNDTPEVRRLLWELLEQYCRV
jgi:NAD(P)-dependent dehydrogenase (short-subunit alcohol dehydrogenase family)